MTDDRLLKVIAELRRFAAWAPDTKEDFARWHDEAQRVHEHVHALSTLGVEVDEHYWHYMSDADIRARDPRYKEIQQKGFLALIDSLERQIAQPLDDI